MALNVDDLEAPKDLFGSRAPDSYPLELVDFETWRELQCNIAMKLFFQFGKIWVVDRKGSLKSRDWEGQNYLSISTGSASCACKEDWGEA